MEPHPISFDSADGSAASIDWNRSLASRAGAWSLRELREILPPTAFFIGFNLIVLTTNLILADYLAAFGKLMIATTAALVVGKAVLVANALRFLAATIALR